MSNQLIREYAKISGVKLWEVAERLNMQDTNLSKMLRHQLSNDKENELMTIIDQIAKEKEGGGSA